MSSNRPAPTAVDDLRVLVVGAASGIGAAIADRLEARRATVLRADRDGARWDAAVPEESRLVLDVTDESSVRQAVREAEETLGALDAVVNCAGVLGVVAAFEDSSRVDFERVIQVNLMGAFLLSKEVLPAMRGRGYGRLVHLASIAGKEGNPQMAGYSASKAGVIGLVKALGREYADTGVTVNAVAPASIETPLILGMTPERREVQRQLIPMRRFGSVDEAAALIEFIISPENSFTTGFVYDLSGGRAVY